MEMDPEAQAHLAGLISGARAGPIGTSSDEWKTNTFRGFSSALSALQAVGAVTIDEGQDWTSRMLVALGEEPLEPPPPGFRGARFISFGARPPRPPDVPPSSVFLGLVSVNEPDRPLDYGGRVQILGVELYSTKVAVAWRLAPEPDYKVLFADELAAQERDLEGVPDLQREQLRRQLLHHLKVQRKHLELSDDVGTEYHHMGGGSSGGGGEQVGRTQFAPAVPHRASRLSISWDELVFDIALPTESLG
jgi:hypothetical protein